MKAWKHVTPIIISRWVAEMRKKKQFNYTVGYLLQSQYSAVRLYVLLRLIASIQNVFETETKA